eukprot:1187006-Prorocentrum_minimum.AAC.2
MREKRRTVALLLGARGPKTELNPKDVQISPRFALLGANRQGVVDRWRAGGHRAAGAPADFIHTHPAGRYDVAITTLLLRCCYHRIGSAPMHLRGPIA